MSEHDEQAALFQLIAYRRVQVPELDMAFAVPNGGKRDDAVAAQLQKEGVRRGVPDVVVPVPRSGYHGLFIELKYGKNKPEPEQLEWHAKLREQGYRVEVCYGWRAAWGVLLEYLGVGDLGIKEA